MATTVRELFQVEIRTRDLRRSMAFYSGVFDWAIFQAEADYALVDSGVMPVISLYETRDPRFPIGACNMVLVDDCQRLGDQAVAQGGRLTVRRFELPNAGAYLGTVDPWGNELFFWEPYTDGRPRLKGSGVNPVVLVDIAAGDLAAALAYYTSLVGWSFWSVVTGSDSAFSEGCGLRRGISIVCDPATGRTAGTTDFVAVADLAQTEAKVREHGGRIITPAAERTGEGHVLVFEDPVGVRMGALQPRP